MMANKIRIVIELERGIMSTQSNISTVETIGILNGAIFNLIRNASGGGVGNPNAQPDPELPPPEARGRNRATGFVVRKADS